MCLRALMGDQRICRRALPYLGSWGMYWAVPSLWYDAIPSGSKYGILRYLGNIERFETFRTKKHIGLTA